MKALIIFLTFGLIFTSCKDNDQALKDYYESRKNAILKLSDYNGGDLQWCFPEISKDSIFNDTLILDLNIVAIPTDVDQLWQWTASNYNKNSISEYSTVKINLKPYCYLEEKSNSFSYKYSKNPVKGPGNFEFQSYDSDPDRREKLTIRTLKDHQFSFSGTFSRFTSNSRAPEEEYCLQIEYKDSIDTYSIQKDYKPWMELDKDLFINLVTADKTFGDTTKIGFTMTHILNFRSMETYRGIKYALKNIKGYEILSPLNPSVKSFTVDGFLGFVRVSESDKTAYCSTSMEGVNIKYFVDTDSGYLKGIQVTYSDKSTDTIERFALYRNE